MQGNKEQIVSPFIPLDNARALKLAENHKVFGVLADPRICNDNQLQFYMKKFSSDKFAEFVFTVFVEKGLINYIKFLILGQYWKLLSQPDAFDAELEDFLTAYPNLSWLHNIKTHSFRQASSTLSNLADQEQSSYTKKMVILKTKETDHSRLFLVFLNCLSSQNLQSQKIRFESSMPGSTIWKVKKNIIR